MMHSGMSEITNPTTGIRLSRKIIIDSANRYGNGSKKKPRIHKPTTVNRVLNRAMRICASMTLPKEEMNFLPKYSSST
ncbi:hypothetical protein D3C75_1180760 [compost metagenome]